TFFFQAEDGIRDRNVTGVQTCALPILLHGSQLMIHEASTFAVGTKSEMQKTLNALKSMDNSIVDIYHEKTGLDKTEILQLMEERSEERRVGKECRQWSSRKETRK